MNLKINGNGNGKGNGKDNGGRLIKGVLLILAILLVGVLLFRQVDRWIGPKATAWVASANLQAGSLLGEDQVAPKKMRQKSLPDGAVTDPGSLEGMRLRRAKSSGEPIVAGDLVPGNAQAQPGLSGMVPEGRVLVALRFEPHSAPYTQYRRGDRLEVVSVGNDGSRVVASDAFLIGWITPASGGNGNGKKDTLFGIDLSPPTLVRAGGNSSLLLGLHPEHVFPVAEAEAAGAKMSFVLHGEKELREGRLLSLPAPGPDSAVELIAGARRVQVAVN